MAEKDITEKMLVSYNDVFADIVNVLLFDGEEKVKPEELEDKTARSFYSENTNIKELERDVCKKWIKENIRIACIGMENQTFADNDMPLRIMGYDGAEYRSQLKEKERYPVVTIVLYFGYKKPWNKAKSLYEAINVPQYFRPYVNDYKINLVEVAYLPLETIHKFKSDFRVVAEHFYHLRMKDNYRPDPIELNHAMEILYLLSAVTKDDRYKEAYHLVKPQEGEKVVMCEYLDTLINTGESRGRILGLNEGRISTNLMAIENISKAMNISADAAMDILKIPESERQSYRDKLK